MLFEHQQRSRAKAAQPIFPLREPGTSANGQIKSRPAHGAIGRATVAQTPLPFEVDAWLRKLDAAHEEEGEEYPPTVRKRLIYVLDRGLHSGGLMVDIRSIDLKRDGTPGAASRRLQAEQLLRSGQPPKFLRPSDRAILRQLDVHGAERSEEFIAALRGMIATGRARWAAWNGPVLTEGEPVRGEVTWVVADDGGQRLELTLPEPCIALLLAEPWYVNPVTGTTGPVESSLPSRVIRTMLEGPALPPAIADRVREGMDRRWPDRVLPAPKPIAPPVMLRESLQPHLLLLAGDLPFDPTIFMTRGALTPGRYRSPPPQTGPHRVALAHLSWRYGPLSYRARFTDSATTSGSMAESCTR